MTRVVNSDLRYEFEPAESGRNSIFQQLQHELDEKCDELNILNARLADLQENIELAEKDMQDIQIQMEAAANGEALM